MANLSAEQLQKYADIVTHAYPDAVAKQLPSNCSNIQIENINATNFTNIAYVSLHAQNKKTRQGAKECLANLQSRFKKKK